jgi:hypothetical protein
VVAPGRRRHRIVLDPPLQSCLTSTGVAPDIDGSRVPSTLDLPPQALHALSYNTQRERECVCITELSDLDGVESDLHGSATAPSLGHRTRHRTPSSLDSPPHALLTGSTPRDLLAGCAPHALLVGS